MRLFLDSADRRAWDRWLLTGMFHGVTTNPTLLQRAGLTSTLATAAELVQHAIGLGVREIQVQTWGNETARLLANGLALAGIDSRVVVKVPVTLDGVRAARALHEAGVRTTLTAVYAQHQAVTAAAIGSDYAAPYFGRIGDMGRDAMAEMRAMSAVLRAGGGRTRLLVASIRTTDDLAALAAAGMDTVTVGPPVAEAMFADAATAQAAAAFEHAASGG